jgi:cytochrome c oxidase assembly protein subunit 15
MQNASATPTARLLATGFFALVGLSYLLIVLGALVRANDAGLACPDWPLCFGKLVPRFDVKVAFEYTHRVVAGGLALCFVWLAWRTLRDVELRARCGAVLALAAGLLVAQIILGGLTVLQLLAAWTVTSHLLTGNAFAATLLWIGLALKDAERGEPAAPQTSGASRAAIAASALLLALQMLLGGLVASRYAGLACSHWPACGPEGWFPSFEGAVGLHLLHRWNAVLVAATLAGAWLACRNVPALRGLTTLALALATAQFIVGVANVLLELPVEVTGLHSALAAALVLTWTATVRAAGLFRRQPRD